LLQEEKVKAEDRKIKDGVLTEQERSVDPKKVKSDLLECEMTQSGECKSAALASSTDVTVDERVSYEQEVNKITSQDKKMKKTDEADSNVDEEKYEIELIKAIYPSIEKVEVKWKGYSQNDNSLEPFDQIRKTDFGKKQRF
jgi:hypothetical protein